MEIYWRLFFNTQDSHKANKLTVQVMGLLGEGCSVYSCEPYWKDKSLYVVEIRQLLPTISIQDVIWNMECAGENKCIIY